MKFSAFRKFAVGRQTVEEYLSRTMDKILSELQTGLTAMTFGDNIDGFFAEVSIGAGKSLNVNNKLTTVPGGFIVVRQRGNGLITEDTTKRWSLQDLWIKNNGAETVTAKIFFLR